MQPNHDRADPTPLQKLLYLGGKRASTPHRPWIEHVVNDLDTRQRGVLLSLPNAALLMIAGLFGVLLGSSGAAMFLVASPLVLLAGTFFEPIRSRRTSWLARRNNLA